MKRIKFAHNLPLPKVAINNIGYIPPHIFCVYTNIVKAGEKNHYILFCNLLFFLLELECLFVSGLTHR